VSAIRERPVFEVDGRVFTWNDVVQAARTWKVWSEVEVRVRQTAALERYVGSRGELPPDAEVKAASNEFRYARNLLSADEMEEWLTHWGITVGEWQGQILGAMLRERAGERQAGDSAAEDDSFEEAVWAEAVCSGDLQGVARSLADHVAVAAARGANVVELQDLSDSGMHRLAKVYGAFRSGTVTNDAIERELATQYLPWTSLECDVLVHPAEDPLREVVLCVREDAQPLAAVALEAGIPLREQRLLIQDAEAEIAPSLIGARPGDLLGPLRVGDGFILLAVRERLPPSAADPVVRERASHQLIRRAVDREVSARVRWHERI
jgi:hypothetical protein